MKEETNYRKSNHMLIRAMMKYLTIFVRLQDFLQYILNEELQRKNTENVAEKWKWKEGL